MGGTSLSEVSSETMRRVDLASSFDLGHAKLQRGTSFSERKLFWEEPLLLRGEVREKSCQ